MKKIILLMICCIFLTSCSYISSNIVKLRGDEIKGSFAGSPVNITGKGVVITIYREMVVSCKKLSSDFSKKIQVIDDKEKGDILLER